MIILARLEFELAYYDSAVHRFNHYTTRTPPSATKTRYENFLVRSNCGVTSWGLIVEEDGETLVNFFGDVCFIFCHNRIQISCCGFVERNIRGRNEDEIITGKEVRHMITKIPLTLILVLHLLSKTTPKNNGITVCYILTFWPGQKCHSKVMHRKEVTHSNGSYERKSRGRKLADEIGRAKKIPMVHS